MRLLFCILLVILSSPVFAQTDSTFCVKQHRVSVFAIDYQKFVDGICVSEVTTNLEGDTIGWGSRINTANGVIWDSYILSKKDTLLISRVIYNEVNAPLLRIRYPKIHPDTAYLEKNEFGDRKYYNKKEPIQYVYNSQNRKIKQWYGDQKDYYILFTYDEAGLLIREDMIYENTDDNYYVLLKYDSKENLIESTGFDLNHLPLSQDKYEYDEDSFLVKEWGYVETPFTPENLWEIRYEKIKCQ